MRSWLYRVVGLLVVAVALGLGVLQQSCCFRRKLFAYFLRSRPDDSAWSREVVCPFVGNVSGVVVDVGTGTGLTLWCYKDIAPSLKKLVLVEPNPEFAADLRQKAEDYGLSDVTSVHDVVPADVKGKANFVVSVHLLCSVDGVVLDSLLTDMADSLVPGGEYLAIDHTTAPIGSWTRWMQEVIAPVWEIIGNGCKFLDMPALYRGRVAAAFGSRLDPTTFTIEEFSFPLMPLPVAHPHARLRAAVKP